MSHVYTPSNTGPITAGYTHPDDLVDDADAASVNGPMEAMADDIHHIVTGDTTFAGSKTYEGSQLTTTEDLTIDVNSDNFEVNYGGSAIVYTYASVPTINIPISGEVRSVNSFGVTQSTGVTWYPINNVIAVGETYLFPITELPNRATLSDIIIRINPADDALPTTKVQVRLTRVALDGSGTDVIATIEDPATGAGYTASHAFESNWEHEIRLDLYSYFFAIIGESGGDTDAVSMLCAPAIRYSMSVQDLAR